ncbi:LCP family protein [Paenibacillus donghaensis]|uniref:Transcriptional regulator n=1 Tax=Paenibacillus donghaensis TaxID=414771 RepID=A0A2Z2KD53_9BACL|nr:LCP family protein [Paenibacillus donghaensis]ASA23577.1 transcriptional regulator [Paenibacillus donghaensis]
MTTRNNNLPSRTPGGSNRGRPSGTASKSRNTAASKTKPKKGPFARLARALLILLLVAILAGLGYGGYLWWKLEHGVFNTDAGGSIDPAQSASVKPLTILLLGTDNRPKHASNLTDVIMVASLNPDTKSATVVSLPRDTLVQLSGYKQTKINEVYTRFKRNEAESGKRAEDQIKTMMGKYLGVEVDYVVLLDFQGFRDVVDKLGKVSVNISRDMCYTDSVDGTDINLTKGPAKLDGDSALDYVRYRKSNCKPKTAASDDFDRNKRQNEVLNALVDKLQSLGGVLKIGGVLDAVDDNMKTDIEGEQIKDLITTYMKISKSDIEFKPVTGTWHSPFVYINDKELEAAKQSLQDRIAGKSSGAAVAP